jgi:hypothetical protein
MYTFFIILKYRYSKYFVDYKKYITRELKNSIKSDKIKSLYLYVVCPTMVLNMLLVLFLLIQHNHLYPVL